MGLEAVKTLYDKSGSAAAAVAALADNPDLPAALAAAEQQQEWCQQHGVAIVTIDDPRYPARLRDTPDAPLVLYVRGNADLNARRTLAIVGTRHATTYGTDATAAIVRALPQPTTIVSGLAYGIDIAAHRAALAAAQPTIAVVAHGQDTIYPTLHAREARQMTEQGGAIVTEYPTATRIFGQNFLQRNRIIAAMSDATLVAESAHHGGGLATAKHATRYGRRTFALPGNIGAPYSVGTNNLIRRQQATLVTSADDIAAEMHWHAAERPKAVQRQLFPDLSPEEQAIAQTLQKADATPADIAANTTMPLPTVFATLSMLEMTGLVTQTAKGAYHLIGQ